MCSRAACARGAAAFASCGFSLRAAFPLWLLPPCHVQTQPLRDLPRPLRCELSGRMWSSAAHLWARAGWPSIVLVSLGAASHEWPLVPEVISSFLSLLFVSWALCHTPWGSRDCGGMCVGTYICMWKKSNSWKLAAVVEGAMAGITAYVPVTGMRLLGCAVADTWDEAQWAIAGSVGPSLG